MIRTIKISDYIQVQGVVEGTDTQGRMMIRVGKRLFVGLPV
jgi:hypothetical protein